MSPKNRQTFQQAAGAAPPAQSPHDGRRESFASIMNMLNPTAIKDDKNYGPEDIEGLFIRRFKKLLNRFGTTCKKIRVIYTPKFLSESLNQNVFYSSGYLGEMIGDKFMSTKASGLSLTLPLVLIRVVCVSILQLI